MKWSFELQGAVLKVPDTYKEMVTSWADAGQRAALLDRYASGERSFLPGVPPPLVLALPPAEVLALLRRRLGSEVVDLALDAEQTDPDRPAAELPVSLRGPAACEEDGAWLRRANVVGINVRTLGSFWDVIAYSLTLPAAQDTIHLLPIWETGVVDSLYGMSSWEINPEFFNPGLADACPALDSVQRQLRAVINLLHAGGRTVGMDVIPHTDRYSEMALLQPEHFEWLRRDDLEITDHHEDLHLQVQQRIMTFLRCNGPATPIEGCGGVLPTDAGELFSPEVSEARRQRLLLGRASDHAGRLRRRIALIKFLRAADFEPVPATMAPPYRGLEVDPGEQAQRRDEHGLVWRDFVISEPREMSRVFGPLARYKLYGRRDQNARWEIDFDRPRRRVWRYVCSHYAHAALTYGFDFMRGDMSHVQMRPDGVPAQPDAHYDLLRAVKHCVQKERPGFAYFAESFLAPAGVMAYGDEAAHLEASEAEVTLGDLQSTRVGSVEFAGRMRQYLDLARARSFAPCFTIMTADKDDPRFDEFYLRGNAARLFLGLFLHDLPSYVGLGFELRDAHPEPAPNEHYTKLFVFHETSGPKATHGPYVWGTNGRLFATLSRVRLLAEQIYPDLDGRRAHWLLPPDPTLDTPVWAWTQQGDDPRYLFVVNVDSKEPAERFTIPGLGLPEPPRPRCIFSTRDPEPKETLEHNGYHYFVKRLEPSEARAYALERKPVG